MLKVKSLNWRENIKIELAQPAAIIYWAINENICSPVHKMSLRTVLLPH